MLALPFKIMSLIILKSYFWGMEGASVLGWSRWHFLFCLLWLSIQCTRGAWSSQGYHHQLCFRNGSDTIRHSIFFCCMWPNFWETVPNPTSGKSKLTAYSHTTVSFQPNLLEADCSRGEIIVMWKARMASSSTGECLGPVRCTSTCDCSIKIVECSIRMH